MLLYLHVPFCRRKCGYCAFYSEALPSGSSPERLALWAEALRKEMRREAARLGHPRVSTVFFGGGTPSLVPPELMEQLLEHAAGCFRLDGDAEISMEANPESVSAERARAFFRAGVNRVSLGVQALDDALLRAVGRIHDRAAALAAFRALREAGFTNVGLDLIWGLPGESPAGWERQLREAAELRPEHLSCYGLTLEEDTPLFLARDSAPFPDEAAQAAMYEACGDILEGCGYRQYEISNYALPGRACRHNLGYWRGEDYLGLGPSAVSTVGKHRWSRPADLSAWLEEVRGGRPPSGQEELGFTEQAEELVMLRLRMVEGLPLHEYRALTGRDFAADNAALLRALEREGLARLESGHFRLTRQGMLVSNSIIEQCFENLPGGPSS